VTESAALRGGAPVAATVVVVTVFVVAAQQFLHLRLEVGRAHGLGFNPPGPVVDANHLLVQWHLIVVAAAAAFDAIEL